MKNMLSLALLAAVILALSSSNINAWPGTVVAVYDGDTLTIEDDQAKRHRVRLWGIDAPEMGQNGGEEASKHLRAVALFQDVDVQGVAYDRYARLLAVVVRPEGWSLNGNMVRMGYAWASGSKRWKGAEQRAREHGRGIWRDSCPKKPWEWRKQHKSPHRKQ